MGNLTVCGYSGMIEGTTGHGTTYEEAFENANLSDEQREQNGLFAIGIGLILLLLVILACIHKKK